ncbi:MAG: MmgE/PrpD family protein [Gammaproteobacteria bacterium]|nr:MmgE/PrpD family protein [Gammaproteobacteria bacterium]
MSANGKGNGSDITRELAEFASAIRYHTLPVAVRERVPLIVLDHVGISLRARHEAALVPAMTTALQTLGYTAGGSNRQCTVIGDQSGYAPAAAALFNGNLGHVLDFDDTHTGGSIHSGAPIIPAALAAAEMVGANGEQLIAGVAAGFEIQLRLSLALNPTEHYNRGFHPTATCGVFGAAAAAGVVLGLDADAMQSAFGLCGSHAAGSMQFLADGAWNKPYHTGFAAANGLHAAVMAQSGFRGASEAFAGRFGFLKAYAPNPDPARALEGLGERFEQLDIAVKPYPSCRYSHAAMDAVAALRAEHDIRADEVESVSIGLGENGMMIIGEPLADKQQPKNYVDGQFSMPFCAAVVLSDGTMVWDSYARHLADERTLSLCRKIGTVFDPQVQAQFPAYMSGSATIRTSRGEFHKLVVIPKGEPENFMSEAELRAKFDGLVGPYLSESGRETLAQRLFALDEQTDITSLLALTRPVAGAASRA